MIVGIKVRRGRWINGEKNKMSCLTLPLLFNLHLLSTAIINYSATIFPTAPSC